MKMKNKKYIYLLKLLYKLIQIKSNNIGNYNVYIGDYLTAMEHYKKALLMINEIDSKRWLGATLCDIGTLYM